MRVRTITQAVDEIRAKDPESQIGYKALSRMVKDGSIPSVKIGNRVLIDMDNIEEAFGSPGVNQKIGYNPDPVINK